MGLHRGCSVSDKNGGSRAAAVIRETRSSTRCRPRNHQSTKLPAIPYASLGSMPAIICGNSRSKARDSISQAPSTNGRPGSLDAVTRNWSPVIGYDKARAATRIAANDRDPLTFEQKARWPSGAIRMNGGASTRIVDPPGSWFGWRRRQLNRVSVKHDEASNGSLVGPSLYSISLNMSDPACPESSIGQNDCLSGFVAIDTTILRDVGDGSPRPFFFVFPGIHARKPGSAGVSIQRFMATPASSVPQCARSTFDLSVRGGPGPGMAARLPQRHLDP